MEDFDPADFIQEENYDAYEDKYADDFDMMAEIEEDMVDFNVQKVNKKTRTNADLDKSLLHLETNNNGTKSLSVKRGRDDEVDADEEVLQYSDNELNDLPKKKFKPKKLKLDDSPKKINSTKDDISDLLANLKSDINELPVNDAQQNITRKRVFRRPVLGEDSLNVTSTEGDRVFLKLHPDDDGKPIEQNKWQAHASRNNLNLLSIPFDQLKAEVIEKRHLRSMQRLESLSANIERNAEKAEFKAEELWVEKYTPKKYTELLSDDGTNRHLLRWLKLWDDVVFKKGTKTNKKQKKVAEKKEQQQTLMKDGKPTFQKYDFEDDLVLDNKGRPKRKIALLCGNPGLGKTTLAHVISHHAGYNVVEMNASDDRSPEVFLNKIESTTQMKASISASKRPNCLVIDEIDGAPIQAINILLDIVKATEMAGGKNKKKRKKREFILNRPIICICNDQYVPALRQLRQVAFTLRFPPTLASRLTNRLLMISQLESLRIDMTTLLLLSEKAENDIRSCLNTLQFIQQRVKEFKPDDLKTMEIGQKDMKKGLWMILTEVFQLPRTKKKLSGIDANPKTSAGARFYYMLHLVSGNTEFEKMMQGLFDQYLNSRTKDPYMESIIMGADWLEFSDLVQEKVQRQQSFVLHRYSAFLPVAFHMYFARATAPKIQYSNVAYENYLKKSHNLQTLQLMKNGIVPHLRRNLLKNVTLLDIVPYLFLITLPSLRPVNTKLYSESEKQMFASLVDVMIACNLTYRQERNPEGQYTYLLEPNIEELTTFTGLPQHRHLPYGTKQLIAREVDLEKMRRAEKVMKASEEMNIVPVDKTNKRADVVSRQKLEPKKIKSTDHHQNLDFFGRVVQVKETQETTLKKDGKKKSILNKDIRFRFNAGYTNAVRRTVKIHEFL